MPDLGRDAEGATEQGAPVHDAATDAGAERHQQQVVDVFAGTEPELAPGGRVGVVLHHDRKIHDLPDPCGERFVSPFDVGREPHRGAIDVDEASGSDADGDGHLVTGQALDQRGDDVRDLVGVTGRRLGGRGQQRPVGRDQPGRDLGAAEVDTDGWQTRGHERS